MKKLKIIKNEHIRIGYEVTAIEQIEYTEIEAEYNDDGQLVREERFNNDGTLNTLTVNTYNDKKQLEKSEQYDQDSILLQKNINTYDENGNLQSQSNFFGDSDDEYLTKYVYNSAEQLEKQEVYFNGELDYVEKKMTYSDNLLVKEEEYDDYGNLLYLTSYKYDENQRVKEFTREEPQNKDSRTYEFTYDEQGNCTKELVYDYGMKLIAKIYRTFDNENRLLEYTDEDLDNFRRVKMEYVGDLVVKNTILDKNDQIVGWAEYSYDENGKESTSVEYIRDEVEPSNFRILRETRYVREN